MPDGAVKCPTGPSNSRLYGGNIKSNALGLPGGGGWSRLDLTRTLRPYGNSALASSHEWTNAIKKWHKFNVFQSESSVFKRLGETDAASPPSTTHTGALTIRTIRGVRSRIVSDDSPEKPAKSHSVLRPLKPIRAVQPVKPVSTVKARVSADTTKESSRKSVFSRLGSQTWFTRIFELLNRSNRFLKLW
jgi:hypothetical protein